MGRQHQGMDRPGVRQVPEGSGEQGKMEKTGCEIICGAPVTVAVKELMMMMMQGRFGVTATYICCSECVLIISLRVTMVTPVFLESTVQCLWDNAILVKSKHRIESVAVEVSTELTVHSLTANSKKCAYCGLHR